MLTGLAMVIMDVLHVRLGFSFSAGLFDYVINFGKATRPLLLLPVGLVYFALYYGVFRFVIARFELKTPGRDDEPTDVTAAAPPESERTQALIAALGGAGNLVSVDACTTRLRLVVANQSVVDEAALRRLGVRGLVRPSANALQVVLGPIADQVAGDMRAALRGGGGAATSPTRAPVPVVVDAADERFDPELAARLLAALGGGGNVNAIDVVSTRLLISLRDATPVDETALRSIGLRGIARPAPDRLHLLIGPGAAKALQELRALVPYRPQAVPAP